MDAMWQSLHEQLRAIANGSSSVLWGHDVRRFVDAYRAHMEREESMIAPMALRLLDEQQMAQLGQAMRVRRGIAEPDPIGISVAALRKDYGHATLSQADVADDPITQFGSWFAQAIKAEVAEPNAMSLSTVDLRGRPSSRIVLIKQFDPSGFTWYTNYDSDKGRQLAHHPYGALLFFWSELERQIRIEGKVERTTAEESDLYFHSRPLKSRLAAIASAQSMPISSRADLEANYAAIALQSGEQPPRPDNWGGFRLVPERVEFWQGRRSRFHDRIAYTLQEDGSWKRQRLQP
jgi:pyridoxamine 5'-phosphate oxidase